MKKLFVFLLVCLLTVANLSAQAVDKFISPGTAFTINSTAAASAGSTYRWLENGDVIPNATAANYTIPSTKTPGTYTYVRQSKSGDCSDWQGSNAYTVSVVGLVVGSTTWAGMNVDVPNTFAASPDAYGQVYQFNRKVGYHATSPGSGSAYGSGWITDFPGYSWSDEENPCPSGWHVPSEGDWEALNAIGSSWANAGVRGNAVAGRFFGFRSASCSLPNDMANCIFLPAVGYRNSNDGALYSQGFEGYYWSSTVNSTRLPTRLNFSSSNSILSESGLMAGHSVRCIK